MNLPTDEQLNPYLKAITLLIIGFVIGFIYSGRLTPIERHCFFQDWMNPDPICIKKEIK